MEMIVKTALPKLLAKHGFGPVPVLRLLEIGLERAGELPSILRNSRNIYVPFSVHAHRKCHGDLSVAGVTVEFLLESSIDIAV